MFLSGMMPQKTEAPTHHAWGFSSLFVPRSFPMEEIRGKAL